MDNQEATSLDTLLDDTTPAPSAPEPTPEVQQEAPAEQGVKEPISTPPVEAKAEPSQSDDGPLVPRRALEDERRKRQENAKALEDLQAKFEALQKNIAPQQQAAPPVQEFTPPDPWTDPQGALEYQRSMFQEQIFATRLVTSEEIYRQQKPDYDEFANVVAEEVLRNPGLKQQILNHPFPAKLVYEAGRKIKMLREIGNDPDAYKAKVIADWQAQNQQQAPQAQQPPQQAQSISVPKSLAGTPSAQPRAANGRWTGPASLDDLLGG
jgi:hypothetical protein